jgi:hypothetical protein
MRRRLPALLLLYVTLDFANPLMPGAVRFEAGSMDTVQADRAASLARSVTAPARLDATFPKDAVVPPAATVDRPVPMRPVTSTIAFRTVRRPPPQRLEAPRFPSEDH